MASPTITIERETSHRIVVTFNVPSPLTLSDLAALVFRVKKCFAQTDAQAHIEKVINLGDPKHDLPNNIIRMDLTNTETNIDPDTYSYGWRGTWTDGKVFKPDIGDFIVEPVVNLGA